MSALVESPSRFAIRSPSPARASIDSIRDARCFASSASARAAVGLSEQLVGHHDLHVEGVLRGLVRLALGDLVGARLGELRLELLQQRRDRRDLPLRRRLARPRGGDVRPGRVVDPGCGGGGGRTGQQLRDEGRDRERRERTTTHRPVPAVAAPPASTIS